MKYPPKKTHQILPDRETLDGYTRWVEEIYFSANRWTHGWISVFIRAWNRFNKNHANESAAGIAFFSIFSIIPLIVFVIFAISPLITSSVVQEGLEKFLATAFPVSLAGLMDVINPLLDSTKSLGLIAILGFLWAASNMFNFILLSINRSWNIRGSRGFIKNRLLSLAFVTAMAVLVVLLFILLFFLRLFAGLFPLLRNQLLTIGLPLLIQVLLIYLIYKLAPTIAVNTKAVLIGAILATAAIEITTRAFTWYINSNWSAYNTYYGSLGAIIGLLFWVFLIYWILLYGAYLSESIFARWSSEKPNEFFEPLVLTSSRFGF